MKLPIFCTLTLVLVFLGRCAFAQAAAESVLLNGSTSTATVKAGSALGSVLNQSMQKIAGKLPQPAPGKKTQVPARSVPTTPHKAAAAYTRTAPAPGPMISSIQGVGTCASAHPAASTAESKAAAETVSTNCTGPGSSSQSSPDKYKSVITLSISK